MTMKRKSAAEIFRIHKRTRTVPTGEAASHDLPGSRGPPNFPDKAESSNARIRREAVEEFKRSPKVRDQVDAAGAQSFVGGFYPCTRWVNYHSPQLELKTYTFSTTPPEFRYPPYNYLDETKTALAAGEEERLEEEEDDEEAEEVEADGVVEELLVDGEEEGEDRSFEEEED